MYMPANNVGQDRAPERVTSPCSTVCGPQWGSLRGWGLLHAWGPESSSGVFAHVLGGAAGCQPGSQQELLHGVSLHGLPWASTQHGSWVPRTSVPGEPGTSPISLYYPAPVVTDHYCCGLKPTQIQGEGMQGECGVTSWEKHVGWEILWMPSLANTVCHLGLVGDHRL